MPTPLSSVPELSDAFLRGIEAAHAIASPQQFFLWLRLHLHRFVPHELLLCWSDSGSIGGARHARVFNCVPLPQPLRDELADPAANWWQRLAEQWRQRDGRACQVTLATLANGSETPGTASALVEAGFADMQLHGVASCAQAAHAAPACLFAFFQSAGADTGHPTLAADSPPTPPSPQAQQSLQSLELWMPYLQFAWWRAEAGAARLATRGPVTALSPLTPRELQVLSAVRDAKANAQIGVLLGISALTVKNHLRSIQRKLGARNRAHAVAEAMSRRLIS